MTATLLRTLGKLSVFALLSGALQGCLMSTDRPVGEFGVGTFSVEIQDPDRPERMTKASDDFRRLALQFWYPSDPHHRIPGHERGLCTYVETNPCVA